MVSCLIIGVVWVIFDGLDLEFVFDVYGCLGLKGFYYNVLMWWRGRGGGSCVRVRRFGLSFVI